jgi:hypothetical protein
MRGSILKTLIILIMDAREVKSLEEINNRKKLMLNKNIIKLRNLIRVYLKF